jgi:hypothetical protein
MAPQGIALADLVDSLKKCLCVADLLIGVRHMGFAPAPYERSRRGGEMKVKKLFFRALYSATALSVMVFVLGAGAKHPKGH